MDASDTETSCHSSAQCSDGTTQFARRPNDGKLAPVNGSTAGFDDPEEIDDWLRARCFDATGAQKVGARRDYARTGRAPHVEGVRDYEDTIGWKTSRGDLSLDAARRIVTRRFWNT